VVARIVKKMVDEFAVQLAAKKVALKVGPDCYPWLAKRGFSPVFGAREVGRLVQEKIKNHFVDEILFGRLKNGGTARIAIRNDELVIRIITPKK
jgi:ATP-dependent Clp protease ATP-binding subunit ClpA